MPLSEESKGKIKEVEGILAGHITGDVNKALVYLLVEKGMITLGEVQEAIKKVRDYTFEKTI